MTKSSDYPRCPECGRPAVLPYTDHHGKHSIRCRNCDIVYDCITTVIRHYDTVIQDNPYNDKEDEHNGN